MIRKSRFSFSFEYENSFFVYNTASNCLLKIDKNTFDFIEMVSVSSIDDVTPFPVEIAKELKSQRIITTEEEDNEIVDAIRMKNIVSSYDTDVLGLTIAPTLSCNLSCPYCFETNKPAGVIDYETCDKIIGFIKRYCKAKKLYLTWFGGEPMLCPDKIRYLLGKIIKLDTIELAYQDIVTNGTLLTPENWNLFRDYHFNSVQVTLDGKKETHDKKRFFNSGLGTFDKIISNVKTFVGEFPDVEISIRVNIDKTNSNEFIDVFKFIAQEFCGKKNINVYPGVIKNCGAKTSNSVFLNNADVANLIESHVAEGIGIKFPQHRLTSCGASCLYSYVIGPRGELYKCWEDIGNEKREIGCVYSRDFSNPALFNKYMLYGSRYSSTECQKCSVLPICTKDCPHDRLANIFEGAEKELCCVYKDNDSEFINWLMGNYYNITKKH